MTFLKIQITKFISNHQPGFVECKFMDAWDKEQIIEEKIPVVSNIDLNANSIYPQDSFIACILVREWTNNKGQKLKRINTAEIWGIMTINGDFEFDVFDEQLFEAET